MWMWFKDPKDAEKASLSMHFTSYETTDENKKYLRNLPKEAIFILTIRL